MKLFYSLEEAYQEKLIDSSCKERFYTNYPLFVTKKISQFCREGKEIKGIYNKHTFVKNTTEYYFYILDGYEDVVKKMILKALNE